LKQLRPILAWSNNNELNTRKSRPRQSHWSKTIATTNDNLFLF
jgi:hypothetical protein